MSVQEIILLSCNIKPVLLKVVSWDVDDVCQVPLKKHSNCDQGKPESTSYPPQNHTTGKEQ